MLLKIIFLIFGIIIFGILIWFFVLNKSSVSNITTDKTNEILKIESPTPTKISVEKIKILLKNLQIPWAMDFLPNGSIVFTERAGEIKLINQDGKLEDLPIGVIDDVHHSGEGGLLGVAIHPDFSKNKYVYFYYTFSGDDTNTLNRVVRFKLENNKLSDKKIIVDNIPGAVFHNGGRIKFGPDGYLYITTGDAGEPSLSQDKNSLAGKILRVDTEGNAAPNNPFDNRVYSYGHRNPQGLAWDEMGKLWETEHGSTTMDEINLIEVGKNYGWPEIRGEETKSGMETPFLHSGNGTWAPSGAAYLNNKLYFAGLRGQDLFELDLGSKNLRKIFNGEYGRIRELIVGPDKRLYIFTNNTDGRGVPRDGDDKLIILNTNSL